MLRYRSLICLLLIFATACVPVTSSTVDSQTANSAEASEVAADLAHEESEQGVEDAGEHEHEDETTDEHADEHADEHNHESEAEHREHGAHVHGAAALMIAWSGNEMAIDLETPAYNILGFEYAPTSDEEQALLAESVAALEAGDLLLINPDAECAVVSAEVQTSLTEEAHDAEQAHSEHEEGEEGHEEEGHAEETHSDIDVAYNLTCQQPENIASLDAGALFAQFPNFADIEVQWVSDTQQSAGDLTPENPVLSFE